MATANPLQQLTHPKRGLPLSENTMLTLLSIVIDDLDLNDNFPFLLGDDPILDFFSLSLNEQDFIKSSSRLRNIINYTYTELISLEPAAERYLLCLAKFHRARLRYNEIISNKPLPMTEAVAGKGLLHYGLSDESVIINYLKCSKWIYDVDNRAAQEVGYLLEPIIAAAIGGRSFSAKVSPVKRKDATGVGRQVDCLKGNTVYEIKSKLTNAASGQGRWKEELSFPEDCLDSGYKPVLLVLFTAKDESHDRLDELTGKYKECGGEAHAGPLAWDYLNRIAGNPMSLFLNKYIKRPLTKLKEAEKNSAVTITADSAGVVKVSDSVGSMDLSHRYISSGEKHG